MMTDFCNQTRMTILVVGGAGYIGSHTCKALKENGFNPVVYDNLSNGHAWAVQYGPLVVGDILDDGLLDQTIKNYQPQAVFHFASLIDARASMHDPSGYYQNNVVGSLRLLQAMTRNNLKRLVFSSTAAVYGQPIRDKLDENHPCAPVNVYGHTKWMTEQMIRDFGMETVILRYFNAAGADLEGKLGEAHTPETHLIPNALKTALGKQSYLKMMGDGTAIRDFIHVTDLARAHVQALEWLLSGKGSMTFNLGTGKGHSVQEIVTMVEKLTKNTIKKEWGATHPADPFALVADSTRAGELLRWKPQHSDLETIITTALGWESR